MNINCASCGGGLQIQYRYSKMVVCNYCGQTSYLMGSNATAEGQKIILADYGSILKTGAFITLKGKKARVLGRLRFEYDGGFWDEWMLLLDGEEPQNEAWLQEDEGEFILYRKENVPAITEIFSDFEVGKTATINQKDIFVAERHHATINGGEGELPFRVKPGEKADFVDGIGVGTSVPFSLEFMPEATVLNVGEVLTINDILL